MSVAQLVELEEVFDAIAEDPRHGDVRVVYRRAIDERAFSTWSMGFRNVATSPPADSPRPRGRT